MALRIVSLHAFHLRFYFLRNGLVQRLQCWHNVDTVIFKYATDCRFGDAPTDVILNWTNARRMLLHAVLEVILEASLVCLDLSTEI